MKKIKIVLVPLLFLALVVFISGCSYSSYPARPYYGNGYGYNGGYGGYGYRGLPGYGYRYGYAQSPRVVVVTPPLRVSYRNYAPQDNSLGNRGYGGAGSAGRYGGRSSGTSNRSYGGMARSRGPR